MAPIRVRHPERLGKNALKLYKSNYNNLEEVHKTKLANINLRNSFLRNWDRTQRQNLHDTYESIAPAHPGLVPPRLRAMHQHKHHIRQLLEGDGVFHDPKKGILAY